MGNQEMKYIKYLLSIIFLAFFLNLSVAQHRTYRQFRTFQYQNSIFYTFLKNSFCIGNPVQVTDKIALHYSISTNGQIVAIIQYKMNSHERLINSLSTQPIKDELELVFWNSKTKELSNPIHIDKNWYPSISDVRWDSKSNNIYFSVSESHGTRIYKINRLTSNVKNILVLNKNVLENEIFTTSDFFAHSYTVQSDNGNHITNIVVYDEELNHLYSHTLPYKAYADLTDDENLLVISDGIKKDIFNLRTKITSRADKLTIQLHRRGPRERFGPPFQKNYLQKHYKQFDNAGLLIYTNPYAFLMLANIAQ